MWRSHKYCLFLFHTFNSTGSLAGDSDVMLVAANVALSHKPQAEMRISPVTLFLANSGFFVNSKICSLQTKWQVTSYALKPQKALYNFSDTDSRTPHHL